MDNTNTVQELTEREKRLVLALVIVTGAMEKLKEALSQETGKEVAIMATNGRKGTSPFAFTVDALKACFGEDSKEASKRYHEIESNWTQWPEMVDVNLDDLKAAGLNSSIRLN